MIRPISCYQHVGEVRLTWPPTPRSSSSSSSSSPPPPSPASSTEGTPTESINLPSKQAKTREFIFICSSRKQLKSVIEGKEATPGYDVCNYKEKYCEDAQKYPYGLIKRKLREARAMRELDFKIFDKPDTERRKAKFEYDFRMM